MAWLNSPALRRLGLSLRGSHPRLYASLNRVRKKIISRGRDVDAYQATAIDRFRQFASIENSVVLEVGSDLQMRVLRALVSCGVREAVGINSDSAFWKENPSGAVTSGKASLERGDATALSFPDASFDYILSIATFEHLLDLPAALNEMHRVLRPGGLLYSSFGPIWSSGKGHHVCVYVGDEVAHHCRPETNPLPDHCHLLLSPTELRRSLETRASPVLVEPVVERVFRCDDINRLFYEQYIEIFRASPFDIISLEPERDPVDGQLRRILEFVYPGKQSFDITNLEVVLRSGKHR